MSGRRGWIGPALLLGVLAACGVEPAEGTRRVVDLSGAGWTLTWRPDLLLDTEQRVLHFGKEQSGRPDLWTRRLLQDLAVVLELVDEEGRVVLDRARVAAGGEDEAEKETGQYLFHGVYRLCLVLYSCIR